MRRGPTPAATPKDADRVPEHEQQLSQMALRAERMFQAEAGIIADGVGGQETVRALALLGDRSGSGPVVAMLRDG